jgi:RimJ/RimL family protein N-acetyltransferase
MGSPGVTDVTVDVRPLTAADIPALRTLLTITLDTSAHIAGVCEAMEWSADRIRERTLGLWVGNELQAVVLLGQVLRVVSTTPSLTPIVVNLLHEHRTPETAAVMGPEAVIAALHGSLPEATLRQFTVWERVVEPRAAARVGPPTAAQVPAFAAASWRAFREEMGIAPVASPDDRAYLDLWERARQRGRVLGFWDDEGRCIFRLEIRPSLGLVAEIRGLWLEPSRRGAGMAHALLVDALGSVATHVAPRAQVIADDDHIIAARLYRRAGFAPVGRLWRLDLPRVGA